MERASFLKGKIAVTDEIDTFEEACNRADAKRAAADHGSSAGEEKKPRPTQAEILIGLSAKIKKLFQYQDRAYADIRVGGHRETWPIKSTRFRQWLKRLYFAEHAKAPTSEAVQEAIDHVEAKALFEGKSLQVHLRIGGLDGRIYIDLGNDQWDAVEIDDDGWRIVDEPPVRFRRAPGMRALARPERGGSIGTLRKFLNVADDGDFVLLVSWLLAALRERGPYPVLAIGGEQGTAKSTLIAILRGLIDPNASPLRALPREDRDLFIQANNSWLLAFDNISGLSPWISDTVCRLATGGGFAVRQLYTDQDEVLFDASRPIALNGITDMVGRADLADRTIFVVLDPIPERARRAEEELWAEVERERPRIFGVLLDAISHGLRRAPDIRPNRLPRMADFAKWAMACETAFWPAGTFMSAYDANQGEAVEVLIEGDQVATAIKKLMGTRVQWKGTATALKEELETVAFGSDAAVRRLPKGWPTDAAHLTGAVRRGAAALRKIGIYVSKGAGRERRQIHITTAEDRGNQSSQASPASPNAENVNGGNGVGRDAGFDGVASPSVTSDRGRVTEPSSVTGSVTPNPLKTNGGDGGDGRDAEIGRFSEDAGIPDLCLLGPAGDDDLDIPDDLKRCEHCGKPGADRWDLNCRAVFLHEGCSHAWADRQEAHDAFEMESMRKNERNCSRHGGPH
jgi:hypothetical protein